MAITILNNCVFDFNVFQISLSLLFGNDYYGTETTCFFQALYYQQSEGDITGEGGLSGDMRTRSLSSLYSPMMPRQSPNILLPPDPFSFNPPFMHMSPMMGPRLLRRAGDVEQVINNWTKTC